MPEIVSILPALAIAALLCLGVDCYATIRLTQSSENSTTSKGRLSDLIFFTPFIALYYHDEFWINLPFTLPLILITVATQGFAYKKGWLKASPEEWTMIPGPYLLAIVGYFMFFREGILTTPSPSSTAPEISVEMETSGWVSFWPYITGLSIFLFTITRKSTDGITLSLLLFTLIITILPFFTDHYWWAMGAGLVLFLIAVQRMFRIRKRSINPT
ncbi:hypothetical protein [Microbulbifer halophilus]|uniref:Uncharacterized protein n=1 Tax=Microbulbifer halophilus TaxID=453963 RepID=A0ABW5EH94_9GAMM|nr:hypothetical protein [Microbulbifer halophilus]MCW8128695.1 hypothetical protein [Microbulbifer halophilus]